MEAGIPQPHPRIPFPVGHREPGRRDPVLLEDATAVAKALAWVGQGIDFADGLHLAKAEGCDAFVSFDRDFVRAANALGGVAVRTP